MIRIALFGQPGSGKSTLAQNIAERLHARVIEASTAVVFPIAAHVKKLPNEETLIEQLRQLSKRKSFASREDAMNMFDRLRLKYGADFIARALHELFLENSKQPTLVFSGLRGIDNAKYCRLHNDFVVYLKVDDQTAIRRLMKSRGYTKQQAVDELKKEQVLYQTKQIEKIANLVIDTTTMSIDRSAKLIEDTIKQWNQMCTHCVNTARNPAIRFMKNGLCHICDTYQTHFDPTHLQEELEFLESFIGTGSNDHDILVGLSGGKDSTATLLSIKQMGFNPLAVTFNLGYLPRTTMPRSKEMAKLLETPHEEIDIRSYIRPIDHASYEKTVALYEKPFTLETKLAFQKAYAEGRKHYSVKCKHSPIFVRTCQLCRRMVIRAYYDETLKRGARAIVLGINEWTNLSAAQSGKEYKVSGVRKLQPYKNKPAVYVFHLPFLLQRTSRETKAMLKKIGWTPPVGEDFIESNSNSCLFARSTERMAKRLLGFHPDSTRLAREVTVGFITKEQALKALGKLHPYKDTPREVLRKAKILK
ncbi:MAG: AAA family ATPase [Candidatus Uhrbacteria bacterium]|nr:AAA family ATPase [Candidatus Uhrbacteria bacterium]